MHNTYLRQKVLVHVEEYASMQERLKEKLGHGHENGITGASAPPQENIPSAPSAPQASAPSAPGDASAPSAPPIETFQSTECCVCMERKVIAYK